MSELASKVQQGAIATSIARACQVQTAGQEFGALARLLRTEYAAAHKRSMAATRNGDVVAKRLSAFSNAVIRALFAEAIRMHPFAAEKIAICATGGFGRNRLAPLSDIDLLFLHNFKNEDEIKPVLEFVLYALYDAGLTVGQSVHTVKSAILFAKQDMVARTSFLDARLIVGEQTIFKDFSNRFDRLRQTTKNQFVKAKLLEQENRHDRSNQSRFLAEPDLKEGKGGLRDLHLLRWLNKYYFDCEIDEPVAKQKILTPEDVSAFLKAERFLWTLRVQLHTIRKRPNEVISFEIQPELADRLNYADRAGSIPAERLMKHYFVNATEIGRLTRIFCTRLEEDQQKRRPRAPKMMPVMLTQDEAPGKTNLQLKNGRLAFKSPARAKTTPRDFFRLFRAFAKRPDIDFSPDALDLIRQHIPSVTSDVRRDPQCCELFVKTLMNAKDPIKTLRVMSEVGLLGKFLPFFGMIAGRIEYGLYRRYTLDEHIFQSVGLLSQFKRGDEAEEHPITTAIVKNYPDLTPFYLLILFREARHSLLDPTDADVERKVRRIAKRLGLADEQADNVAWAAARYDRMIKLCESRKLTDINVIADFAQDVKTRTRLDMLLCATICDLRNLSPRAWNSWSRQQLTNLYSATLACLENGPDGVQDWFDARAAAARFQISEALGLSKKRGGKLGAKAIPDDILCSLDTEQLLRFSKLAQAAADEGAQSAVDAHLNGDMIEVMVFAVDRPGLLADLAGAIASAGANVKTVQVTTTKDGKALDIFTIQPPEGANDHASELVGRLHKSLLSVASGDEMTSVQLPQRLGDRRAIFSVPAMVRTDLDASVDCTVIEAEGRDRPGLLYLLAEALTEIGVTILSAHIATYGERAVDTFYLQDAPGYKIKNKRRIQSIERRLLNVLRQEN